MMNVPDEASILTKYSGIVSRGHATSGGLYNVLNIGYVRQLASRLDIRRTSYAMFNFLYIMRRIFI
jgi:hypothetical protein